MGDTARISSAPPPPAAVEPTNVDEHENVKEQVGNGYDKNDVGCLRTKNGLRTCKSNDSSAEESDDSSDSEQENDYKGESDLDSDVIDGLEEGINLAYDPPERVKRIPPWYINLCKMREEEGKANFPQQVIKRQRLSESAAEIESDPDMPDLEDLEEDYF